MNPSLIVLRQMQGLDDQVRELLAEKEEILSQGRGLQKALAAEEAGLSALRMEAAEFQKKEKAREIELAALEEKRGRLKTQLMTIKTNKEYAALQTEIKVLSADIDRMEESGLADLTAIDGIAARVREKEALVGAAKAKLEEHAAREGEAFARIETSIDALRADCEKLSNQADAEAIALYRRIAGSRDGVAVARVSGTSCGGCSMYLTPQTINLLMGAGDIVQCRSCQRILYLEPVDPEKPEKVEKVEKAGKKKK